MSGRKRTLIAGPPDRPHLGIVSGVAREIRLLEIINQMIPPPGHPAACDSRRCGLGLGVEPPELRQSPSLSDSGLLRDEADGNLWMRLWLLLG